MRYTMILHQARVDLGLSMNDYCIADCIYHYSNNPKRPGWCFASKRHIGDQLGVTKEWVIKSIKKLESLGIIEKSEDGRLLRTSEKWYNAVIEPENNGEQSSSVSVNDVHTIGERCSPPTDIKSNTKRDSKSLQDKEKVFYDEIATHVLKFGKKTCREFFEYWSEWNDRKTMMKWEIEKKKRGTFDIQKRLGTWEKKSELYTPKKINQQNGHQVVEKASMPETYRPA